MVEGVRDRSRDAMGGGVVRGVRRGGGGGGGGGGLGGGGGGGGAQLCRTGASRFVALRSAGAEDESRGRVGRRGVRGFREGTHHVVGSVRGAVDTHLHVHAPSLRSSGGWGGGRERQRARGRGASAAIGEAESGHPPRDAVGGGAARGRRRGGGRGGGREMPREEGTGDARGRDARPPGDLRRRGPCSRPGRRGGTAAGPPRSGPRGSFSPAAPWTARRTTRRDRARTPRPRPRPRTTADRPPARRRSRPSSRAKYRSCARATPLPRGADRTGLRATTKTLARAV